jgi:hypothetical protein
LKENLEKSIEFFINEILPVDISSEKELCRLRMKISINQDFKRFTVNDLIDLDSYISSRENGQEEIDKQKEKAFIAFKEYRSKYSINTIEEILLRIPSINIDEEIQKNLNQIEIFESQNSMIRKKMLEEAKLVQDLYDKDYVLLMQECWDELILGIYNLVTREGYDFDFFLINIPERRENVVLEKDHPSHKGHPELDNGGYKYIVLDNLKQVIDQEIVEFGRIEPFYYREQNISDKHTMMLDWKAIICGENDRRGLIAFREIYNIKDFINKPDSELTKYNGSGIMTSQRFMELNSRLIAFNALREPNGSLPGTRFQIETMVNSSLPDIRKNLENIVNYRKLQKEVYLGIIEEDRIGKA